MDTKGDTLRGLRHALPGGPDQWLRTMFWIALGIAIMPLWLNKYFITGDGPCHLYNAQVVLDYVTSDHTAFYNQYYELNLQANPNWLTHILLAFLLSFLPGFLAEKILLTVYVAGFAFALRGLIRRINPKSEFLILLGLPLVYAYPLQMGFLNYMFSIVIYLACLNVFLHFKQKFTWGKVVVFAILNFVLYCTHPIGWLLLVGTVGLLVFFEYPVEKKNVASQDGRKRFWLFSAKIMVAFVPTISLFGEYLIRRGTTMVPNTYSFKALFYDLVEMRSLIVMSLMEVVWALWIAVLFGALFLFTFWTKMRSGRVVWADAFFILFVCTLILYFFQPGGMAGAGILKERLSFLPYVICLPWLASAVYQQRVKWVIAGLAFFLGVMLIFARLPVYHGASQAVGEIMTVRDSIQDHSTVLPLSFSHSGKRLDGEHISNRIWLFMHAADYLGVGKHLVMLGNYEAHTGYFPLRWKDDLDPFRYLSASAEGIEAQPPYVNIEAFRSETGKDVDYVLTTFLDEEFSNRRETIALLEELEENYTEVIMNTSWRVRLYRRNGRPPTIYPKSVR